MINVIIADHQAIFRAGVAKVLAVEDDIRIVGQPHSHEQMLNALEHLRAHVLLISTSFLPLYRRDSGAHDASQSTANPGGG